MSDLLFKTEEGIFSYRAGGVLIRQGKVLLQRDRNAVYATVGGHVAFGETAAQALPAGETLPCYREDGRPREDLEMVWVPVEQLSELEVYPRELPELLRTPEGMVGHLVSRE